MPRNLQITLGILAVAVLVGLISLRGLHKRIETLAEQPASDERARRELREQAITSPEDVTEKARIFWAAGADRVAPVEVDLPLSHDAVQRAKQVLHELVDDPPTAQQRTLPPDVAVVGFYILTDGTAVADFSSALASETPSGILSERLAVDSIARTLEANVAGLRRLKILIQGQEVETLAGHLDLTGFFDLQSSAASPR